MTIYEFLRELVLEYHLTEEEVLFLLSTFKDSLECAS